MDFLERIPAIRELLAGDVQAATTANPAAFNTDEIIMAYPGVCAVSVYRFAHELHVMGVPLVPRVMTEWAPTMTGVDIHPGARIGRSFFSIDHGTGVVIGETADIGDNVKI
jgi:serine O-acetyltransferase